MLSPNNVTLEAVFARVQADQLKILCGRVNGVPVDGVEFAHVDPLVVHSSHVDIIITSRWDHMNKFRSLRQHSTKP